MGNEGLAPQGGNSWDKKGSPGLALPLHKVKQQRWEALAQATPKVRNP
jgi:hypothetical protein